MPDFTECQAPTWKRRPQTTITGVAKPDEVAYFRSRLCTDSQSSAANQGVYMEVDVQRNPDNLSLALVDFEAGGCSSITFSPDTGAVIRERKVREAPRKVEGAYIQSLPSVPPGRLFTGRIGLFLHKGRLSFFRRCAADMFPPAPAPEAIASEAAASGAVPEQPASEQAPAPTTSSTGPQLPAPIPTVDDDSGLAAWESTGFISDISWAEGGLTPCLAFRDEGAYQVQIVTVGTQPPLPTQDWTAEDDRTMGWSGFDWEVGPLAEGADGPE